MRTRWLVLIWVLAAVWLAWWVGHDPLPDGFQNEFLHVGNAYDLWGALVHLDQWHLRWYMYTGYWPWGFYAVPWPIMALIGPSRLALVAGNLVHLAVLLWGANTVGRALGARLAPALLVLTPGVFGTLVRFEPNLAAIAWVMAGLAFLVQSNGLRRRAPVLGWGVALGLGLMMDRLSVAFFLVPAVLPLLWRADRRAWKNLGLGWGVALLLSFAYYREFFLRNSGELLSQAPVGEIDSAGAVSVGSGGGLWYLLALLDSQAGPVMGGLMLVGALVAGRELVLRRGAWRPRAVLLSATLPAALLFTLIAKKQVFYTLPVLGPLAVLAAARGRWAWLALAGGLWVFADAGLGLVPPGLPGSPWMPVSWVAPRHTLARPPTGPVPGFAALEQAMEALAEIPGCPGPGAWDRGAIAVLSEDERLFEGFVVLSLRERYPKAQVRGVVLDPVGTYEMFAQSDKLLQVGPVGADWPGQAVVERQLLNDHYDLSVLPPVARTLERERTQFEISGRWRGSGTEVTVWHRAGVDACLSSR